MGRFRAPGRGPPSERRRPSLPTLGLNLISIDTRQGLYVLAYRPLRLDVKKRALRAEAEPVICREFTVNGSKLSIHQFLDADDYTLLDEFTKHAETIKDLITRSNPRVRVDDLPYLVAISRDCPVDLEHEYRGILTMFEDPSGETATAPLRAFFGEMTAKPRRRKSYPLALLNNKVNLDQLLAINNAMRYPLAYVQGPPGTGKTNTIVNTLTTAFFNERTVLFSSYNNHPIDGVVEKLQAVTYHGQTVPFPILRLGNNEKTAEALRTIDQLFEQCKKIPVPERLLDKNHADRTARAKQLTALLERYERILDLRERRETIRRLLDARGQMNFQYELQAGQLPQVDRELAAYGSIDSADALALLDRNEDELLRYLYYTSARCIRRLEEPKYNDLMSIVHSPDTDKERVTQFNKYLSEPENLKKLLRVFPIVATTCISAHRLGDPEPSFDMVIMDEASQCSTAMSLVPILRGASLMLVGDPQQLSPVILLDPADNRTLRRRYGVTQEYDYIENSIYKCFLACDAVSDETLLSYHYRCSPKIIEFNNRKYYNHKLHIASRETDPTPLVYVDVPNDTTDEKNTAPQEVRRIEAYLTAHPDKQVGIITPFAKQRAAIEAMLRAKHFENAACGTVHAFQGDEKDVVIFSLALTDQTRPRTYDWLKTNKELINVATSRAREQLVILSNQAALDRLHADSTDDDIYELVQYVRKNGQSEVTEKPAASRALGIKPYSTKTEDAFLEKSEPRAGQRLPLRGGRVRQRPGDAAVGHRLIGEPLWHGLHQRPRLRALLRPQRGPSVLRTRSRPGRPHQPSGSDRRRGLINELMFYIMKHIVFTGRVLPQLSRKGQPPSRKEAVLGTDLRSFPGRSRLSIGSRRTRNRAHESGGGNQRRNGFRILGDRPANRRSAGRPRRIRPASDGNPVRAADSRIREGVHGTKPSRHAPAVSCISNSAHIVCRIELVALCPDHTHR